MPVSVDTTASCRPRSRRWCAARPRGCASAARRPPAASRSPPSGPQPARRAASSGGQPRRATRSSRRAGRRRGSASTPGSRAPARRAAPATKRRDQRERSTRASMRRSNASGIGSGRLSDATADVDPPREQRAADRAEQRHQQRFGDELTHQPAAARADREANADLLLPARRARQQHARDVGARDQQHQTDHRHHAGGDRHDDRIGERDGSARRCVGLQRQRGDPCSSTGFAASSRDISSAGWRAPPRPSCPASSRARMNSHRSARRSSRVVPVGDGTVSCIPTGSTSSDADTGIHISGDSTGTMPLKPAGATPTIV